MNFSSLIQYISPEFATMFVAMLPVSELRGSIPLAIGVYHLSWQKALLWSLLGNIIPAFFVLIFLERVSNFIIKRFSWGQKFLDWLFVRSRRKFKKYEKFGLVGLFLFVSIPLPFTGVWTGSIAAFLLGIKARHAIPYLLAGVFVAGIIVTLLSLGIF